MKEQTATQEASRWFDQGRAEKVDAIAQLPVKKQLEAYQELAELDRKYGEALKSAVRGAKSGQETRVQKPWIQPKEPSFISNPTIDADIVAFREANAALDKEVKNFTRGDLEDRYVLKVMEHNRSFRIKPDMDMKAEISKFREEHPLLSERAAKMPRERLENDHVLNLMRTRYNYDPQMRTFEVFFGKPENKDLLAELETKVEHLSKATPETKRRIMFKEKAPRLLREKGIRIGA